VRVAGALVAPPEGAWACVGPECAVCIMGAHGGTWRLHAAVWADVLADFFFGGLCLWKAAREIRSAIRLVVALAG